MSLYDDVEKKALLMEKFSGKKKSFGTVQITFFFCRRVPDVSGKKSFTPHRHQHQHSLNLLTRISN